MQYFAEAVLKVIEHLFFRRGADNRRGSEPQNRLRRRSM
jgi:hypothetical protein